MVKTKQKATHAVKFRIASLTWLSDVWFSHKEGNDIELLDLQASDIRHSVDQYGQRQWEIQSSVNDGKTWQTQRLIH